MEFLDGVASNTAINRVDHYLRKATDSARASGDTATEAHITEARRELDLLRRDLSRDATR